MSAPVIPVPPPDLGRDGPRCHNCGAGLASDQRYCLNCGSRLAEPRVDFTRTLGLQEPPPPPSKKSNWWSERGAMLTLATVGSVLLALGVGIVIGRGNGGGAKNAAAQVVTVAGNGTAGGSGGSSSGGVQEDWPSGASGYTVELSTLDKSAQASDVQTAKSDATSKGAPSVGVLDGDSHGGTPTGKYVIYSGDYPSDAQAKAALAKVKKSFPNALVLHVTAQGSGASAGGGGTKAAAGVTAGGNGSAGTQGLSQLQSIQGLSGSARSKAEAKLPSQIGTGGSAPPVDNKKAGGGTPGTCIGC